MHYSSDENINYNYIELHACPQMLPLGGAGSYKLSQYIVLRSQTAFSSFKKKQVWLRETSELQYTLEYN